MSRVYEALRQAGLERILAPADVRPPDASVPEMRELPFVSDISVPVWEESELDGSEPVQLGRWPVPAVTSKSFDWGTIEPFCVDASAESRLVTLGEAKEIGSEKFRVLRARLGNLKTKGNIRTVVITSAVPGDGKSLVALNLAISLAKHTEERILIIEGDLHKSVFAGRIGLRGSRGLSEWFSSESPIEKHMYHMRDSMLWVLPAGVPRQHPLGMLQSARFIELMDRLKTNFDWILIDAPPLQPSADVNYLSQQSDGILLVVREGNTPAKLLKKGLETLDSARVLGVVFNDTQILDRAYYEGYYCVDGALPAKG